MPQPLLSREELEVLIALLKSEGWRNEKQIETIDKLRLMALQSIDLSEALEVEARHTMQDSYEDSPPRRIDRYNRIVRALSGGKPL